MKKRMESDLLLKIISVVFAFLLWMFVINTDNPVIKKTFSDVPVDMLNEQVLDDLNQTYAQRQMYLLCQMFMRSRSKLKLYVIRVS